MIKNQFNELAKNCHTLGYGEPKKTDLSDGAILIEIPRVTVEGWNRPSIDILFLAPPGYPNGHPDCFWVQPGSFRLADGSTPQNSGDGNQIPGDLDPNRNTTWFSWHVQRWDPNRDTLSTYFKVILDRLHPAR